MIDRELLELAAKAVKVRGTWVEKHPEDGHQSYACGIGRDGAAPLWNPLVNDGDCFRLAVSMNLRITIYEDGFTCVTASEMIKRRVETVMVKHVDDGLAATRRAIVVAVAETVKARKL